jgi:hypothetical protein
MPFFVTGERTPEPVAKFRRQAEVCGDVLPILPDPISTGGCFRGSES